MTPLWNRGNRSYRSYRSLTFLVWKRFCLLLMVMDGAVAWFPKSWNFSLNPFCFRVTETVAHRLVQAILDLLRGAIASFDKRNSGNLRPIHRANRPSSETLSRGLLEKIHSASTRFLVCFSITVQVRSHPPPAAENARRHILDMYLYLSQTPTRSWLLHMRQSYRLTVAILRLDCQRRK